MNTLLITPEEILEIAFSSTESAREELIGDIKIETAQLKYIRPVFGKLYDRLSESEYEQFVTDYLKLPLALYVKSLVIDETAVTIGAMGVTQPAPRYGVASSLKQLTRLKQQARREADRLLGRAVDYVEQYPALFPDYDPQENILRRITCKGGIAL